MVIEKRWAEKNEQLPELAAGLVDANVDLLVTGGTPATLAVKQTTAAIPIVFIASYPVENGIIASLTRPGGNLTGMALVSQTIKPLERLKEAAPGISHVALLYDPATFPGRGRAEAFSTSSRRQAETLNVILEPVLLQQPGDTDKVFRALPPDTVARRLGYKSFLAGSHLRARDPTAAAGRGQPPAFRQQRLPPELW